MIERALQVVVVDDSKGEKCDARCGVDWSSVEAVNLASQRIKERFGDRIQLEYLDLSEPATGRRALELLQGIKNESLSFPVLLIDGKPRISGQFDIPLLLNAIDAEMELTHE